MAQFSLPNPRLLQANLQNEKLMTRAGAMVAYDGQIKFEKSVMGGEGFFGAVKRKVSGEGFDLMTTSGTGTVYFAYRAHEVLLLPLQNEKMWVESSSVLAFDSTLRSNTAFTGLRGLATGQGLATTTLEGTGQLAIISNRNALMLEVAPGLPVCVDPQAFLGYKGQIQQEFVFDANWKTLVGQGSGETFQLKFSGQGVVYIQPAERGGGLVGDV